MRTWIAVLALCGCSSAEGSFQFSDIERLRVGESTREEVEGFLGKPSSWSARSTVHRTSSFTPIPGPPLSFVSWPLYRGGRAERVTVTSWYDAQNILSDGAITLDSWSLQEIILLLRVQGVDYSLDERLIELLQRLEQTGFKVQVAEGDRHRSLKRFLEEKGVPR